MDSEEKQHEFSNAQWLSKLAFLVDIGPNRKILLSEWIIANMVAESVSQGVGFLRTLEVGFFHPIPTIN